MRRLRSQASPRPLEGLGEAAQVRLTAFERIPSSVEGRDEYVCSLSSEAANKVVGLTVYGHLDPAHLDILHKAILLARPSRNVKARSKCIMSSRTPLGTGAKNLLVLTVRILVPNARSLLDNPALPRRGGFMNLFGAQPVSKASAWSPREFYENVHVPGKGSNPELPDLTGLQCTLYPFQKRAIRWLLERENAVQARSREENRGLSHGFICRQDADGRKCYVSRALGLATTNETLARHDWSQDMKGGILAEEMGLGKVSALPGSSFIHKIHEIMFAHLKGRLGSLHILAKSAPFP